MSGNEKVIPDSKAVREILKAAPLAFYPVPKCGNTPQQVRAAMQLEKTKIPVLICEDCSTEETYLIIPLRDVPYFVVELYRELAGL